MAKVKGPLFSIVAMGQIDNKLIYRGRKGIDDVKKYVKTVNPNTPGQQTQKGYFKNAIDAWSIDGYSAADKFAWDQFAKTKKVITSGFNRFTGFKMVAEKEGSTWNKLTNCTIYNVTGAGFKVDIDVDSDLSGILYLGISKYSMLQEFVGVFSVNKYTFTITGLDQAVRYFFYIKNTSGGEVARTGIYSKKTVVGVPPAIITVGQEAIDRGDYMTKGRTYILLGKTANASGKITRVEMWPYSDMAFSVKVATFFNVSADYYSTRDWESLPVPITGGAKRTFTVDINVEMGDIIGIYFQVGNIERDTAGFEGWRYASLDRIPCVNERFSVLASGQALSLWGRSI